MPVVRVRYRRAVELVHAPCSPKYTWVDQVLAQFSELIGREVRLRSEFVVNELPRKAGTVYHTKRRISYFEVDFDADEEAVEFKLKWL